MRVSVQLFHWEPTKMSFQLTKVSFIWLEPTKASLSSRFGVVSTDISISPVGLCQLSSHPLSIQQNFQMGNNADVKLIFPLTAATVNLSQEADPVKLRRNTFMRSSYIVNKQKKAVWGECSAASVLNPNNVCVSRG